MTQVIFRISVLLVLLSSIACQKKIKATAEKYVVEGNFIDAATNAAFNPYISNTVYLREGTTLGLSTVIATTSANSSGHYRFELSSPLQGNGILRVIANDTLLVQDAYTLNIPVGGTVTCNVTIPCGATWSRSLSKIPKAYDDSLIYEITCEDWINRGGLFFSDPNFEFNVRLRANKPNIAHFTYFKNGVPYNYFDTLTPNCRAVIRDTIVL